MTLTLLKQLYSPLKEEWLDDDKTMIITDSEIEIKNILTSAKHMMRGLHDGILDKYMVCDGYKNIHTDMLNKAFDNYYYDFERGFFGGGIKKVKSNPNTLLFAYFPKDAQEVKDLKSFYQNAVGDGYTILYNFENAFVAAEEDKHHVTFDKLSIFNKLGKCLSKDTLYDLLKNS